MKDDQAYIFEVSAQSFGTSVLLNSNKLPVFVEYMQMWSEPAAVMAETLSRLATEFAGQFIFAKVDIDEQSVLAEEHEIKNIPTLKVFHHGKVVHMELGMKSEPELREVLKSFGVYRESDEMREQARALHMGGETAAAIQLLTKAIQSDPGNVRVVEDMVQVLIDVGQLEQAKGLYERLPDSVKQSENGRSLSGQITFKTLADRTDGRTQLEAQVQADPQNADALFDLSVCLVADHEYVKAADVLFALLELEPEYKEGAAREMIISLSNTLVQSEPEIAQDIRRRLSSWLT
ncbi:MAG: tetratricopeptide repeat protein [bacterium]